VIDHETRIRAIVSNLARLLSAERQRQGLSMTELAVRAGLSQQMISYVEREMRNPTINTLLRITDALKIDLADLIRTAHQRVARGN
jgi:transcriptional regulator with XRE-family HTH domain